MRIWIWLHLFTILELYWTFVNQMNHGSKITKSWFRACFHHRIFLKFYRDVDFIIIYRIQSKIPSNGSKITKSRFWICSHHKIFPKFCRDVDFIIIYFWGLLRPINYRSMQEWLGVLSRSDPKMPKLSPMGSQNGRFLGVVQGGYWTLFWGFYDPWTTEKRSRT